MPVHEQRDAPAPDGGDFVAPTSIGPRPERGTVEQDEAETSRDFKKTPCVEAREGLYGGIEQRDRRPAVV
jgi:hypothetical protein